MSGASRERRTLYGYRLRSASYRFAILVDFLCQRQGPLYRLGERRVRCDHG